MSEKQPPECYQIGISCWGDYAAGTERCEWCQWCHDCADGIDPCEYCDWYSRCKGLPDDEEDFQINSGKEMEK